jgi:rhomboid family GlyGly-CTERM serine protease
MPLAALPELLEFDRHAVLAGEAWRLWTGHLMHYSTQHALVDLATGLAAGAIALRRTGARRLMLALALGAPFISAGLLLIAPQCLYYRGLSGIDIMLVVLAGATLWPNAGRLARGALLSAAAALAAKITAEALGHAQGWSALPPDVAIAWQAHLLGALAGVIAAFVLPSNGAQRT